MPTAHAPTILEISLAALKDNYKIILGRTKAKAAGVIKADGYGLGAAPVFKALFEAGCRDFFVATPDEAAQIRDIDKTVRIFVLGGLYKGAEDFYLAHNIVPVLASIEQIEQWSQHGAEKLIPAAIHFDTGMNRLGLGSDETEYLLQNLQILKNFDLQLAMSHFACSDEKDNPMNIQQNAIFMRIAQRFPNVAKSLCNSSGIFRDVAWHYDLVRPGFALYGGNPTPEAVNPMLPVVSLKSRVLQTRKVKAGQSAGYGATHVFERDTMTATLAAGYADGFLRSGSNKAKFYWNGQPCPIVGRVSMDLIIVDLAAVKNAPPQAGDLMEVVGPHQDVDTFARDCGTIGYEILTDLGRRYHRVYTP
ncbi:MAG: alanine racemase [Micavibrio aeruginosavorus]|uniref:Alanine racemase n=1 Tax=Micavibrio aeruginosavorus TaxID=349221 RepID=A0A2W5MYX8_9BACT|nr:MAG: alanine racemase [Micavibrio aeruginosavorus]